MSDESPFRVFPWLRAVLSEESTLDSSERLVMLALVRHANSSTGIAWPGFGSLGKETGLGRTKIVTSIAELKRRGLLARATPAEALAVYGSAENAPADLQKYFGIPGERRPNLYTLPLVPPLAALALPRENAEIQKGSATRTSAPRELVHVADGTGALSELGGVRQADGGGAPGGPKLLRELPSVTTQVTHPAGTAQEPHQRETSASRRRTTPVDIPVSGAHELKVHYVAEFKRTRNAEPQFGKRWSRAMKSFGELVTNHGLEDAKRRVTRALSDEWVRRINPWELAEDGNKFVGPQPTRAKVGPPRQMGGRSEEVVQSYGADGRQKILDRSAQRAVGA